MKILIFGYFGFDNIGDEAILKTLVRNLPRFIDTAELTTISKKPKKTSQELGIPVVKRSLGAIKKAISDCDIFMLGGGGILQDSTSLKSLLYYLYLINYAKLKKKKVILLAQGIGPINSFIGKTFAKHVLQKVDFITIRDDFSYLELVKIKIKKVGNIFTTADITPLYFDQTLPSAAATKSQYLQIGIAPRKPKKHVKKLIKTLAQTADFLIEKLKAQITFLPLQPCDADFIKHIQANMQHPSRTVKNNLEGLLAKLKEIDVLVGVRLHSLIFATLSNVPSIAIAYDPKVAAFAESTGIPYQDLKELSAQKIKNQIDEILKFKREVKSRLAARAEILKLNALLNLNILKSHLRSISKVTVLGAEINNLASFEVIDFIKRAIQNQSAQQIITVNPELIYQGTKDENILKLINAADLKTADGAGLLWAAKYLKTPLKERITGIDLMEKLLEVANQTGYKIFLLGSNQQTVEQAVANIKNKYPNINLVGYNYGYFTNDQEIIDKIKTAKPDILFVGMGAPKQDYWIAQHKNELNVPVSIGVGGSFDVIAGVKKRAPKWIQKIRAEWVYRLIKEPKRIKRQINLFRFMGTVIKKKKL